MVQTFLFRPNVVAIAALCGLLAVAPAQAANESDREQVRSRVAAGGWNVVWGVNINEAEYAKAAASIHSGSFAAYFSDYLERNIDKVQARAPGIARNTLMETVTRAFKSNGTESRIGRVGVKAGIATYRRWYTTAVKVPDGTERYKVNGPFGSWTWGYRPKFKTVEKKVPLPNHHQPYVGFRLP